MKKQNLLIVDDEERIHDEIKKILADKFTFFKAYDSQKTLSIIEDHDIDIVLLDIWLADEVNGIELLKNIKRLDRDIEVIMMSSDDSLELINQCVDLGIYNYIKKPLNKDEVLISTHISKKIRERIEECEISQAIAKRSEKRDADFIGMSPTIERARELIAKLGKYHGITILIRGESGTGKELVARGLHETYGDKRRPFIALNCGAISPSLMESELFGHERGSFTGAQVRKFGLFELAHRGDIFLDEIAELPLECQAKLLRVLDGNGFRRVGGQDLLTSDFRLLSATNKNLEKLVSEGKFREDLYHRIHGHVIDLPPLRERREDIAILSEYLARKICNRLRIPPKELGDKVIEFFSKLSWRGNVRELSHVLEIMIVNARSDILHPGDFQGIAFEELLSKSAEAGKEGALAYSLYKESKDKGLATALALFEKEALSYALSSNTHLIEAARSLKISRTSLFLKMKKYNLRSGI